MSIRRALRAVTRNFLGTYTSRYSDRNGYWLFGYLAETTKLEIDLLGDRYRRGEEPSEDARMLAMDAFSDQLIKAGVPETSLRTASLTIATSSTIEERLVVGIRRAGRAMTFDVVVVTDRGASYEASCRKFVAPHDPSLELRSVPRKDDAE